MEGVWGFGIEILPYFSLSESFAVFYEDILNLMQDRSSTYFVEDKGLAFC